MSHYVDDKNVFKCSDGLEMGGDMILGHDPTVLA